nr:hypothetical protein CFP56_09051 [Quercus suber]
MPFSYHNGQIPTVSGTAFVFSSFSLVLLAYLAAFGSLDRAVYLFSAPSHRVAKHFRRAYGNRRTGRISREKKQHCMCVKETAGGRRQGFGNDRKDASWASRLETTFCCFWERAERAGKGLVFSGRWSWGCASRRGTGQAKLSSQGSLELNPLYVGQKWIYV